MAQWGAYRRYVSLGNPDENESQVSPIIIEPNVKNEDEFLIKESVDGLLPNKRKRVNLGQPREVEIAHAKQIKGPGISNKNSKNHGNIIERWSADRYKLAEKNMFKVMKDLGATFHNPVSRPVLRKEARKNIGDTGLLDHLLKQMDGKVMPGGTDRFKRCFNTSGVMEYWLESADLLHERQEAGVQEPHWIPPNRLRTGDSAVESSVSAAELRKLKFEITKLKREMQELLNKKPEEEDLRSMKELLVWRAKTEGRVNEIESSVRSAQSMLSEELMTWKTNMEQQLEETKSTLSSLQPLNQDYSFCPPTDQWFEWFGDINVDNFQRDEDRFWFEEPDPDDSERGTMAKDASTLCFRHSIDPICLLDNGKEQHLLEDQSKNVAELAPKIEEQSPETPVSCAIDNSKPELDTSYLMLQELLKWKPKLEQQLTEISNSVRDVQARYGKGKDQSPSKPCTGP